MQVSTFLLYMLREPRSTLRQLHWWLYPRPLLQARFGDVDTYAMTLEGVTVRYDTRDDYSKGWFFPRYTETRIHEEAALSLFARACRSSRCVVDVGTHLGLYTCLAGALTEGPVYGFEIDPRALALANGNVELNGLSNVTNVHAAVGAAEGTVRFALPRKLNPALALSREGDQEVACRSLDVFFQEGPPPELIKIDVEGAEMDVLQGMTSLLREHKPTLFIEMHPHAWADFGTSAEALFEILRDHGLQLFRIRDMRGATQQPPVPVTAPKDLNTNCMLLAGTAGAASFPVEVA